MRPTESIVSRTRLALAAGVLLTATALAGCGTGGMLRTADAVRVTSTPTTSRKSYIIAGSSLPAERYLVDVVRERWPQLASGNLPRGEIDNASALDRFGVYDSKGMFLGGPDVLATLRGRDIAEMRRLTATEEYSRLGKRHPAGAVILTWRLNA